MTKADYLEKYHNKKEIWQLFCDVKDCFVSSGIDRSYNSRSQEVSSFFNARQSGEQAQGLDRHMFIL